MEGPVSTSPLQPPHRTMRRRQLSHARSSWSSGDTPAGPVVVGRSRKAIVPLMAPWEHAIHRWLLIISSDTSCIQLSLWMNGVAQCLFHHIPICDHVFTIQSNTMKFGGKKGSSNDTLFSFMAEWNWRPPQLQFSGASPQTYCHPSKTKIILFKLSTHFSMLVKWLARDEINRTNRKM